MTRKIILLLLISCGDGSGEFKRCYTRDEALNACIVDEMRNKQITEEQARIYCEPFYTVEGCYQL